MLRIGLMGCGMVADFGHAPAISRHPELELVACFDPDEERGAAFAARHGGTRCPTLGDFFAHPLDAVVIASALPAHKANVLECAARSLPVLCEKPIAESVEDAEQMVAAMEAAGAHFVIGMTYRFSPVIAQLKSWVAEDRIGTLRHIRMVYLWNLHGEYTESSPGKWEKSRLWTGRMIEGGPLIDCGVHQIDLIEHITGRRIIDWEGFGAWVSDYEAPDHMTGYFQLEGGLTATVEVSYSYTHNAREPRSLFTYELIGTGGIARFDREGYVLEVRSGDHTTVVPGSGEKNFDGMFEAFATMLKTGERGALATPAEAIQVTRIATECTQQAISRRAIQLVGK